LFTPIIFIPEVLPKSYVPAPQLLLIPTNLHFDSTILHNLNLTKGSPMTDQSFLLNRADCKSNLHNYFCHFLQPHTNPFEFWTFSITAGTNLVVVWSFEF